MLPLICCPRLRICAAKTRLGAWRGNSSQPCTRSIWSVRRCRDNHNRLAHSPFAVRFFFPKHTTPLTARLPNNPCFRNCYFTFRKSNECRSSFSFLKKIQIKLAGCSVRRVTHGTTFIAALKMSAMSGFSFLIAFAQHIMKNESNQLLPFVAVCITQKIQKKSNHVSRRVARGKEYPSRRHPSLHDSKFGQSPSSCAFPPHFVLLKLNLEAVI